MESKTEVIEKRVKPTVIRRRAKAEPPEATPPPEEVKKAAPSVEAAPIVEKEVVAAEPKTAARPVKAEPEAPARKEEPPSKKEETSVVVAPEAEKKPVAAPPAKDKTTDEEDRPRFGLKVVGQITLKPSHREAAGGKTAAKTEAKTAPSPARPGGPAVAPSAPTTPEEEEKDKKVKKVAKKSKREELEVDLDGIGKVATLTQLTRLAAAATPEKVERERVFEPGRSLRKRKGIVKREGKKTEITTKKASKRIIKMGESIIVSELAHEMSVKAGEVIKRLMGMGSMVTLNQPIDFDTASIIAQEYGYEVKKDTFEEAHVLTASEDKPEDLVHRSPVVTVMGHVDHGKTSLLDAIRKTQVASGEAGGITQHIGAYQVALPKGTITFIDTPGHEAFTAMRARGASVTDIVILVVAADDGVMPQTIEAINHAKAAEVPIIVAVNKIDKAEADPDRVKRQLAEHQLVPEDWGGDTIFAHVSAKTQKGIEELLELILLQAEVLELKANPNKPAKGVVIESRLDRGRGPVATILIQEGTLRAGDSVISGVHFGRVRAMRDEAGHEVEAAGPSVPVEIIGLSGVPNAGDVIHAVTEDGMAKILAEHREEKDRAQKMASTSRAKLEDLFGQVQKGETRELRIILKADVQGSMEAIRESLNKLSTDKVRVNLLHLGVGGITESDVMLAAASNAIVVGFNVRPETKAQDLAKAENVQIKVYEIIYNAIEEIKKAMEGLLEPTLQEKYLGRAEVRNVFNISKVGSVAGCFVVDGKIVRNEKVRLLRDNVIVHTGKLSSLKRFKDDAREVAQGYECGMGIEGYNDIKVGDVIECFTVESIAAKL
ncbi:MAG: translation initiation factor IF-2 [bacterium]